MSRCWLLAAAAAGLLLCLPLLAVETPPLYDLPAHVARLAVLIDEGESSRLDAMFDIRWAALPNLALELVTIPLASIMSLDMAVRMFLILALVLQLAGAALLSRAIHGRLTMLPLLAVFFIYNGILYFGFASYVFAVGLTLIALALWLLMRERSPLERLGIFAPLLTVLYFCHLYGLGLFGLSAGAYEIGRAAALHRSGEPHARVAKSAALHLGVLAAAAVPASFILVFASPTGSALSQTTWQDLWLWSSYATKPEKLLFTLEAGISWLDRVLIAALSLILAAGLALRWLRISAAFVVPIALLWFTFMVMPATVASSWGADLRLPLGATLVTVAALAWGPKATPGVRLAVAGALALVCVLRIGGVLAQWIPTSRELTEIRDMLARLPKGSTLTAAVAVENRWRGFIDGGYYHIGGYAVADRDAFYPTVFAFKGQQPIARTPAFEAKARAAGLIDWTRPAIRKAGRGSIPSAKALSVYDYVLVVHPAWFGNRLSPRLERIAGGKTFSLMRVKRQTARR